jgi:hypothetical protein
LQYRLKSLFVLPLVVGVAMYWYDWSRHRPPHQSYDGAFFGAAYWEFEQSVFGGERERDRAYDSTSARFKANLSRQQFEDMIRPHATLRQCQTRQNFDLKNKDDNGLRGWLTAIRMIRGDDGQTIELWVWVVIKDSFFYRRPPMPQVEEFQIREISEAEWKSGVTPPLLASWERKPVQ